MSRTTTRSIGRREALGVIGIGAWAARTVAAQSPPFRFSGLDHVDFSASNSRQTAALYARVFGGTVLKNRETERRYVRLGSAFVAVDQGDDMRVDHFCAGIENFDIGAAHRYLERNGIAYRDYPSGRDLSVEDPDGIRLQLAAANGWRQLQEIGASAEPIPALGEPIFQPTGIEHLLLHVSDPENSAAFYEKILGPVTSRGNGRTWFQVGSSRVGLLKTPDGGKTGVDHYCVYAEPFEFGEVTRKLRQLGVKLPEVEVQGAPEFFDPDGYRVQIMQPAA